jgi:cobalamin biosynthesis Co2+ chelatase CbiK
MYINQMKINKLNKELLVLKEDYAKMIVKLQKQIRTKSGDVYTIAENFTGL